MKERSRILNQEQNKLRIEAVTKLFSAAAMTIATVVVVTIVVPSSPSATLLQTSVFADRIAYQADVVDPDGAIDNDSLKVRLSNQLETYERTLPFGTSIGAFDGLVANTQYLLEIVANKGFGEERLAFERLKTYPKDGGAILDVRRVYDEISFQSNFQIDVVVYNDLDTYTSFELEYAIGYEYYEQYQSESYVEEPLEYTALSIDESPMTIVINQYFSYDTLLYLRLIGHQDNQQFEVLDEMVNRQPFELNAYAGINQVSVRSIEVYLYPDSRVSNSAIYTASIWRNDQKIDEKTIEIPQVTQEQYEMDFKAAFTMLRPLTEYRLLIEATYTNPDTLRQETSEIAELLATTSGTYEYVLDVTDTGMTYSAVVTLIDPSHNFQQFFYEVYEPATPYPIDSGTSGFLSPQNKTATLIIQKPPFSEYRIILGVRNITDYYRYDVLDTITP